MVRLSENLSTDHTFEFPDPVSATDEGYVLEWIMRGTHDRANEQLPASGQPFTIHGVSTGKLRDGRISWNRDYWSMGEFLTSIGLFPPISAGDTPPRTERTAGRRTRSPGPHPR